MTTENRKQMRRCEEPLLKILEAVDEIYAETTHNVVVWTGLNRIRGEVKLIAKRLKLDLTGGDE